MVCIGAFSFLLVLKKKPIHFHLCSGENGSVSFWIAFREIFFFLVGSFFFMLETYCLFLPLLAGNFDWVGNAFTQNAGAGLVINQADAGNSTSIIKQLKAVFERDWYSHYAKSLQPTKIPNCFNHKLNKGTSNKTAMSNVN